ncbi:MAG TPA: elongation factor Ts [Candidatus Paceibacterota bacterium]|jgi:elongation factor Ts|nr:elongation factor Ts [Candidatus Paceibacterota bacterium]
MAITTEQIKELRDKTGVSVSECKKALEESAGDMEKALAFLQERAAAAVGKKADRTLGAGTVAAYVHSNKQVGAMVYLACETDFVSKNEEFVALAYDIAMHISAMRPATKDELLAQAFIKDGDKTIADLISGATQKFGERTDIADFSCFAVA